MNPHAQPATKITTEIWNGPACDWRKFEVRAKATALSLDADTLALHWFDCDVDGLKESQAATLQLELIRIRDEQAPELPAHSVTCAGCDRVYTCGCQKQHRQSICHYCHENVLPYHAERLYWLNG